MEEQFIKYETALLAKEKGFKHDYKNCIYLDEGKFVFYQNYETKEIYALGNNFDEMHPNAGTIEIPLQVDALRQSELQKQLRLKNIDITVITDWKKGKRIYYVGFSFVNSKNEIDIWFSKDEDKNKIEYSTYEDALEVGLLESLETVL